MTHFLHKTTHTNFRAVCEYCPPWPFIAKTRRLTISPSTIVFVMAHVVGSSQCRGQFPSGSFYRDSGGRGRWVHFSSGFSPLDKDRLELLCPKLEYCGHFRSNCSPLRFLETVGCSRSAQTFLIRIRKFIDADPDPSFSKSVILKIELLNLFSFKNNFFWLSNRVL